MQQLKQFIKWHNINIMQEEFKLKKDMQCFEYLEYRQWTKVFGHFQFTLYLNSFSKHYREVKS